MQRGAMERCGAKTRSGEPCKGWPLKGAARCRMHGGASPGAPVANRNGQRHGAYSKLAADRMDSAERELFEAMPSDPDLSAEMRILRFKLVRLLEPGLVQNIVAGYDVEYIDADEFVKVEGITKLVSEIRKLAKDMQETGVDDPLRELVDSWKAGMQSDETPVLPETR